MGMGLGVAGRVAGWGSRVGSGVGSGVRSRTAVNIVADIEVATRRHPGEALAAECCLALESREVERTDAGGVKTNLGSIESLPLTALLQWRIPVRWSIRPYVGAGANLAVFWEKSGLLDSVDLVPTVGPALERGADFDLSPATFLNVDFRWNSSKTDIEERGTKIATLRIHPSSFRAGIGFRF
jgi:outer membrane protein W